MAQQKQAEKGLAKMANRAKVVKKKDIHEGCGGEFRWSMVSPGLKRRGRMLKVCEKCGTAVGKGN